MSILFTPQTANAIFSSTDYNANIQLAEDSFSDLGPYICSGLVPSAGTGLSVNVTAGTAVIGGRVTKSGSWTISGLTNSTTNHLYLLNTGAGTSNTTGTAPANSVKLGSCVTAGGVVTSVNVLRSSGRQTFVRPENQVPGAVGSPGSINLAAWAASAADAVPVYGTLPAGALGSTMVTLTPASSARNVVQPTGDAVVPLAVKRHTITQSANLFEAQDETGTAMTSVDAAGTVAAPIGVFGPSTIPTQAAFNFIIKGDDGFCPAGMFCAVDAGKYFETDFFMKAYNPSAPTPTKSVYQFGANGSYLDSGAFDTDVNFSLYNYARSHVEWATDSVGQFTFNSFTSLGQVGIHTGDAARKCLVLRAHSAQSAVLTEWQDSGGTSQMAVDSNGRDFILDTTTGTKWGTATSQKQAWFGATPVVQRPNTTDLRQALLDFGFVASGGASPLDLNGGNFVANNINLTGVLQGSTAGAGTAFRWASATVTPPSDADYTLSAAEMSCFILSIATGSWTTGRSIIVPLAAGGVWHISNSTGFTLTVKGATGTGINIASARAATLRSNGTNIRRMTADVDPTT